MKLFNKFLLLLAVWLSLIILVASDIGTHCRTQSIIGDWEIERTPTYEVNFPIEHDHENFKAMLCGHELPTNENSAYKVTDFIKPIPTTTKITVTLNKDHVAIFKDDTMPERKGNFTMVYDEGWEATVNTGDSNNYESYFAFLKYTPNEESSDPNKKWKSYCYKTLVGWYHVGNKWGCYIATKLNVNPNEAISYPEETESDSEKKIVTQELMKKGRSKIMRFMETNLKVTLHNEFKDHSTYANHINSMNKSWKAKAYKEYEGKSLAEIRSHLKKGNIKFNSDKTEESSNKSELTFVDDEITKKNKEYMGPAKAQGNCGSCYALSTIGALEARLKKQGEHEHISLDYILECSVYNQGCDGGYSYLVLKMGHESYLPISNCYEKGSKCKLKCNDKVKVTNFNYVGGAFGFGENMEQAIIKELENGPIIASINPPDSFNYYSNGMIDDETIQTWKTEKKSRPDWVKVDHSIILIGPGKAYKNNQLVSEYWLLQNTWGGNWGENGYFKIVKGKDLFGIESLLETGTPIFESTKPKKKVLKLKRIVNRH